MELRRLLPSGEPVSADDAHSGFAFADLAPDDRPYVVVDFVSSLDGRAAIAGRSAPLSNAADRRIFHLLRTQVDAVFAGTGTLRKERYGRIVRDPDLRERRAAAGLAEDPLALVVSRSGDVPWDIPLFDVSEQPVAVYTGAELRPPAVQADVSISQVSAERSLRDALRLARAEHGVRSVLCEGGPHVFGSLLADGLVDELFLCMAPLLAGGDTELGIAVGPALPEAARLELVHALESEDALFLRYRIAR
jgi:riboflavin-specific deaminase-like protein